VEEEEGGILFWFAGGLSSFKLAFYLDWKKASMEFFRLYPLLCKTATQTSSSALVTLFILTMMLLSISSRLPVDVAAISRSRSSFFCKTDFSTNKFQSNWGQRQEVNRRPTGQQYHVKLKVRQGQPHQNLPTAYAYSGGILIFAASRTLLGRSSGGLDFTLEFVIETLQLTRPG